MQIFNVNANFLEEKKIKSLVYKAKSKEEKQKEYQNYLQKQAYINEKTKNLSDFGLVSLIVALSLNVMNVDLAKKLNRKDKIGIGALVLSAVSMIASAIKQTKLSKQYDMENKI